MSDDGVSFVSIKHPEGPEITIDDINDNALQVMPRPSSLPTHFVCNICNKNRHMDYIDFIKWYSSDGCCEWSERVLYCNDSDKCKEKATQRIVDDKERVAYFGNLDVKG